jgi:hypothetical protein
MPLGKAAQYYSKMMDKKGKIQRTNAPAYFIPIQKVL